LFDCGSGSKNNIGEKILIPFLRHQGIEKIDGIFLSHPDTDHVNGVLQVLQSGDMKVGEIFLPDYEGVKEDFEEILEYIPLEQVTYVSAGMRMDGVGFRLSCLHPAIGCYSADHNELSACYLMEIGDVEVLFTGDVSQERGGELIEEWTRQNRSSVDILKVAHHGSRFSTSLEFLQVIKPEMAAISCGKNNSYGHPHTETLARLEKEGIDVHITAQQGAVIIKWKRGSGKACTFFNLWL
jgi:competence protein ComEC